MKHIRCIFHQSLTGLINAYENNLARIVFFVGESFYKVCELLLRGRWQPVEVIYNHNANAAHCRQFLNEVDIA